MSEAGVMAEPAPTRGRGRDRYIDTLRAAALVRVVTYHSFTLIWLPFAFPSMGIMFALAGALVADSLDRGPALVVLRRRLHRLLPPVWVFGLVLIPLMLWHGWTVADDGSAPLTWRTMLFWLLPVSDPPSSQWGFDLVEPLWYIRAYLWFLLASPALRWAWRRYGMATLAVPLAVLVVTQVGWVSVGDGRAGAAITDMATFGACWLLGFAHYDGRLRTLSLRWLLPVAAGVMALGLGWALTHPQAAPDLWDPNNIPLADGLWCLGAVLLLLRFYPSFGWLARHPWLDRLIAAINQRAMTIYLWNNVAVLVAYAAVDHIGWATGWRAAAAVVVLTWAGIGLAVLVVGPVEDLAARRRPAWLPGRPTVSRPATPQPASAPAPATRRPTAVRPTPQVGLGYLLVGLIVGLSSFGLLNVVKSSPAAPSLRPAMNTSAVTVNGDSDQQRVMVRLLKVSDPAVTRSTDYEPDAGHRWIAVRFGLTNTGSVSSRLNLADATELLDATGNFYPSIVDARTNAGPRLADELLLRPGATASGVLVYEVPQSFRPSLVTLSLGDRSDQQTQWAL